MRSLLFLLILAFLQVQLGEPTFQSTNVDTKSHLVKITTTIMIENDGNTPITQHLIDCDERNGHSRLSHIVAKLSNVPMPVSKSEDGKWWRIDISSKPIEPGVTIPLMVTKVYTHLELVPSMDVYLIPYSSIQYQVRIIKQGRPQKVKIPSEQYYLVVDNKDLVDLEESSSTVMALESEGSTKIRFIDKTVIQDDDFIQPESNIHIVNPSYLTMHVQPGDSWALQKYYDYTVEIRIFDANHNQIFPSDNLDIQLIYGSEIVLTNSTANGTYHSIHTITTGPSKLTARLAGTTPTMFSYDKPYPDIELTQELYIYEQLTVKPTAILLPWLPESKPTYKVSFYADGGTGTFKWSTNNTALAEIYYSDEDSSVAKITTNGQGISHIQCADVKSSVFVKESVIVVSKIVELNILPSITETVLDGDLLLPIAVYANRSSLQGFLIDDQAETKSDLVLFHDCSKIKFDIEIVEKSRFSHEPNDLQPNTRNGACVSLKFTCNQPGSSRVWISYTDPTNPLSRPIKTTAVIACYKPLKPVYPSDVGVIALHTSIELAFEGGPRPFGSKSDDHYSYLEPNNSPISKFEPIIDRYRLNKDLHVFRAHCNEYGEVDVTLHIGNKPSLTLPNPASAKSTMKLICGRPDSISIRPKLKESCPLNEMTSLLDTIVPVSTKSSTDFDIVVYDDQRREFLNISSYSIKWTLIGQGTTNSKQHEDINAVGGFRKVTRSYITVQPNGKEGQGKIQAELKQYKSEGLLRTQITDLTSNLDIEFVDYAVTNPNRSIIYNHQKNVVVLSIFKGSGYFTVESIQGAKHANVSYVQVLGQHKVNITPLSVGKFILRLEDLCMETKQGIPILSEISIVNDIDFNKEVLKQGRSLKYCNDVDQSFFCLYLAVDKLHTTTTLPPPTQIPTRSIPSTISPPLSTTLYPKVDIPSHVHREMYTTTVKPAVIKPISRVTQEPTLVISSSPKISFDSSSSNIQEKTGPSNILIALFQKVLGFLLAFILSISCIILGFKWLQERTKCNQSSAQFVTESSFLRQSPNARNVRFSPSHTPSSSGSGPTSSTPKLRPLYSERFSTTLFSD